jgi:hypothetical protein
MGSGMCKDCDKTMTDCDETIGCEFCGAPICEHCITSGAAFESPVDGAIYCRACLLDIPATLARYYRVREVGQGSGAQNIQIEN